MQNANKNAFKYWTLWNIFLCCIWEGGGAAALEGVSSRSVGIALDRVWSWGGYGSGGGMALEEGIILGVEPWGCGSEGAQPWSVVWSRGGMILRGYSPGGGCLPHGIVGRHYPSSLVGGNHVFL